MGPLQPWLASCLRDDVSELKTPTVAVAMHCSNNARAPSDTRTTKGLCRPKRNVLFGQLNSRSLSFTNAKEEFGKHINDFDISVTFNHEHRQVHLQEDPDIKATNIGRSTMFTASATRDRQGAAVGGVGVVVKSTLL